MNDEQTSAQAEGEALPESMWQDAEKILDCADAGLHRVLAAIERWYAAHFHAAATSGRAPISAEDKASLTAHVTEALTPKE
jgi:hypothetical protein